MKYVIDQWISLFRLINWQFLIFLLARTGYKKEFSLKRCHVTFTALAMLSELDRRIPSLYVQMAQRVLWILIIKKADLF